MKIINVTQKDIDNGLNSVCKGRSRYCPVAFALKRVLKNQVAVGATACEILKNKKWKTHPLPRSAQRFIMRFDKNKTVKPFNFRLK